MNATKNSTDTTKKIPEVGDGATLCFPQDRYPYVITRVSDSGKTFWAKRLKEVNLSTGHEPARHEGPWPVWTHVYSDEERQTMVEENTPEIMVRLSKHGYWTSKGLDFALGDAVYHRNFSY